MAESRSRPWRTRWTKRRQRLLEAAGGAASPDVLGQLRHGECGRRGFERARRPHALIRIGEAGRVRRSPQAVAGRKRGVEARGRPQTFLPVANDGVWETALEARQGKPGDGTMLEPERRWETGGRQVEAVRSQGKPTVGGWGVVSSRVLGGGERPPHGEGLDGSTPPGKATPPGQVGPEQHEPTSLRARANRGVPCADASATEEPDAGKLHVRDCTGGVG